MKQQDIESEKFIDNLETIRNNYGILEVYATAFKAGVESLSELRYTEEEVKMLCLFAMEYGESRIKPAYEQIDEWFDSNKKQQ